MTTGTVYAVASGKGGVGKTTTAVNLGAGFARAGRSVVVVDLDLGMANLGDFVEATPAGPTMHDVLAGEATLDDALSHVSDNLDVVLGSEDIESFGKADPTGIRDILTELERRYDVVILDSGGGLSHDTALPLGLADSVLLVSTVEKPAVKNTQKTLELAEILEGDIDGIVLTRVGGGKDEVDPAEVASRLGLKLVGSVPEDSTVKASANAGEPLLTHNPESPAAQAYLEMAYELLGEPIPVDLGGGRESPDLADEAGSPESGSGEMGTVEREVGELEQEPETEDVSDAATAEGEPAATEDVESAIEAAEAEAEAAEEPVETPAGDEEESSAVPEEPPTEEPADETAAEATPAEAETTDQPAEAMAQPDQEGIVLGGSDDESRASEGTAGSAETAEPESEAEEPAAAEGEAAEPSESEPAEATDAEGEGDDEDETEGKLVESPTDEEEEEKSRSFLSKITGGLLG